MYRNFQKRYPVYAEGGAATGAGGRGVRGRFDQQKVEMQDNHTLGTFMMDAGKFMLNQVLTPIETVTGRNFYDPEFNYGGWDKMDNVSSGVGSAATDILGTYFGGPFYTMGKKATQQTVNTLDPEGKLDNTNAQVSEHGGSIKSDKDGQDAVSDPTFKYWFMKNSRRKDVMEASGDLEKLKELFFKDSIMYNKQTGKGEFPVFSGDIDDFGNIDKKQRSIKLNEAILNRGKTEDVETEKYNDGTNVNTTTTTTTSGGTYPVAGGFDLQSLLAQIQASGGNIDINSLTGLLKNYTGGDGGGQFANMFSGISNPSATAGSTTNSTGFGNILGNFGSMIGGENAGAWSSGLNTLGTAMTTPTVGDQFGLDRGNNREWTGFDGGLINTWTTDTPQMIKAQENLFNEQKRQTEIAARPLDYYSQDGAQQFGQTGTSNYMNNAYFRDAQKDWVKNDWSNKLGTSIAKIGNLASNFVGGGGAPGGSGAGMFQGGSFLGAGGGGGITGGGGGGMDFSSMLGSLSGGQGGGGMDFKTLMKNFNMANSNQPVVKHGGRISNRVAGNSRRYNMGTQVSNNNREVTSNENPMSFTSDDITNLTYGANLLSGNNTQGVSWDGNMLTLDQNYQGYLPIEVGNSHERGGTLMNVPAEGQGNTIIEAEKGEGIEVNEYGDSYIYSKNKPKGSKFTFKERKDKREREALNIQNELQEQGELIDPYRKHTLMRLLMALESEEWADRSEQDEIKKRNELKERIELEGLLSGNKISKDGSYVKKGKRKKLTAYQESIYPEMAMGGYPKYENGDDVKNFKCASLQIERATDGSYTYTCGGRPITKEQYIAAMDNGPMSNWRESADFNPDHPDFKITESNTEGNDNTDDNTDGTVSPETQTDPNDTSTPFDIEAELQHLWDNGQFDAVNDIKANLDAGMSIDREAFNNMLIQDHPKALKYVTEHTDASMRAGIENGDLNYKDYKNYNPDASRQDFRDFKKNRTVNKPEKSDKKELYKDYNTANKEHRKNKPKKPKKPTENSTKYKWGTDGSGGWKSGGQEAYNADLATYEEEMVKYNEDKKVWDEKNAELQNQKSELDKQWETINEEYDIAENERKGNFSKVRPNKKDYMIDNPDFDPNQPESFTNRKQIVDKESFNNDLDNWKNEKKTFNQNKKQDKKAQKNVDKGKKPNPKHYRSQEEYQKALEAYNETQKTNNQEKESDVDPNDVDPNDKNNQNNNQNQSSSTQSWDGRGPGDWLGDLGLGYGSTAGIANTKEFWDKYQELPNENFYRKHEVGDRAETILENKEDLIEAARKNTERTLREDLNRQYSLNRDSASSFGNRIARDQNAYNTYAGNKIDADIKYGLMRMGEQDKLADQYWDTDKLTVGADFDVRQDDQEDLAGYYTQLGIDKQNIAKNLQEMGKNRNQSFLNWQLANSLKGNQYSPGPDGIIYFNHEGCTGPGCTHEIHKKNENNQNPCTQEQIDACKAKGEGWILDSTCNCVQGNNNNNNENNNNKGGDKCADLGPCEQEGWVRLESQDCECIDPNAVNNNNNNNNNDAPCEGKICEDPALPFLDQNTCECVAADPNAVNNNDQTNQQNVYAHTYETGQREFSGKYAPGTVGHFQEWNSIFNDPTGRLLSQTGLGEGEYYGTDENWKGVDNNPGGTAKYESGLYKTNTRRLGNTHGNEYYNWMLNEGLIDENWDGNLEGIDASGNKVYMQLDNTRNEQTFNKKIQQDFVSWSQLPENEGKTLDDFYAEMGITPTGEFSNDTIVNPNDTSTVPVEEVIINENDSIPAQRFGGNVPKYNWGSMVQGIMGSGSGGGGFDFSSILGGIGGGEGGGGFDLSSLLGGLGGGKKKEGDKEGKEDKEEKGFLHADGSFRRGIRDAIGSYFLGPLGPEINDMTEGMHIIKHGGDIRQPRKYNFGANVANLNPQVDMFDYMPQFQDSFEATQLKNEQDFINLRKEQANEEIDANELTLIPGLDATSINLAPQGKHGGYTRYNGGAIRESIINSRRAESNKRIEGLQEWLKNRNK